MANQKKPSLSGRQGFVLLVEIFYLLVLFGVALFYLTDLHNLLPFTIPGSFGSITIGVPWFGALGAVMISLSGIFDHRKDWDPSTKYWHFARPLVGATLGIISVLIFQAGILAVGASPAPAAGVTAPANLLYYLIAFLVGYREETFRALIKRLTDVILAPGGDGAPAPGANITPGEGAPSPVITALNPLQGKVNGGDNVIIKGSGFTGTTHVKFGPTLANNIKVDSDSQITAVTPAGAPGKVSVTITTNAGSVTGGEFTYGL